MMSNALQHNAHDDRQSTRTEVKLRAILEAGPANHATVTVLNISAHGIMARCETRVQPGRAVTLDLAGLDRTTGRVAWARDNHLGVAFDTPLSVAQIMAIL